MKCPKCSHEQSNTFECESCGIIFDKFAQRQKELDSMHVSSSDDYGQSSASRGKVYILAAGVMGVCILIYMFFASSDTDVPSKVLANRIPDVPHSESLMHGIEKQLNDAHPPKNSIEKARNATVFVKTAWSIGSGFFIDKDCHIITNRHVVEFDLDKMTELREKLSTLESFIEHEKKYIANIERRAAGIRGDSPEWFKTELINRKENLTKAEDDYETITSNLDDIEHGFTGREFKVILIDGTEFDGMDAEFSENHDLALLNISESDCPYITPGNSTELQQGEKIFTIGNPEGLAYTVTSGIFSGYRNVEENTYIQTDAPINSGNSGGPMIDDKGKAIGINTWVHRRARSIGFAIPIETALNEFKHSINN